MVRNSSISSGFICCVLFRSRRRGPRSGSKNRVRLSGMSKDGQGPGERERRSSARKHEDPAEIRGWEGDLGRMGVGLSRFCRLDWVYIRIERFRFACETSARCWFKAPFSSSLSLPEPIWCGTLDHPRATHCWPCFASPCRFADACRRHWHRRRPPVLEFV